LSRRVGRSGSADGGAEKQPATEHEQELKRADSNNGFHGRYLHAIGFAIVPDHCASLPIGEQSRHRVSGHVLVRQEKPVLRRPSKGRRWLKIFTLGEDTRRECSDAIAAFRLDAFDKDIRTPLARPAHAVLLSMSGAYRGGYACRSW